MDKIYDEIEQIGVPESSVIIQGNTAFVYVVKDNLVEKRNIKIGKSFLIVGSCVSGSLNQVIRISKIMSSI